LLAQTQKQNRRQNRGVCAHKGAQTSDVIKFLSILTKHTGAKCNQPVELAKDWKSDCLAKRNLVGVELCGVLGRLHSIKGLAQSNNDAKLNYSAKHEQKVVGNECQKWRETNVGGKVWWDEKTKLPERKPRRVKGKNTAREGLRCVGWRRAWGGVVASPGFPMGSLFFLTFSFFCLSFPFL
jgi:hypothetical protein